MQVPGAVIMKDILRLGGHQMQSEAERSIVRRSGIELSHLEGGNRKQSVVVFITSAMSDVLNFKLR